MPTIHLQCYTDDDGNFVVQGFSFTKRNIKALCQLFKGRVFAMEFREIRRSERVNNYYQFLMTEMAKEIGYNMRVFKDTVIKPYFVKYLLNEDHDLDLDKLLVKVSDPFTGEDKGHILAPTETFTDKEMSELIDFSINLFKSAYPDWIAPDPALFEGKRKGQTNSCLVKRDEKSFL